MNLTMRARAFAGAVAVAALGTGCKNFLTSNDALNNPNSPTAASNQQRLTAVETNFELIQTGDPARTIAIFMNQFAGTLMQSSAVANYGIDETTGNGTWATVYTGGGIIDLRGIEQSADAAGDSTTSGIARVMEAWEIGTAADIFGDVPYSTAFQVGTNATLDPQATIYANVQTLLDRGIKQLQANAGPGPASADLFYGGDRTKWIQAAYTLKARYYLHTAEKAGTAADGTPAFDQAAYQSALTAAANGIASRANDMLSYASTATTENNLLYQFAAVARPGYVAPHAFLVNLMTARSDPRLPQYFTPASGQTVILGSTASGLGTGPGATAASFNAATGIGSQSYRWRMLSYGENQLILAEAYYRTGNAAAALTAYNAERTSAGLTAVTSLPSGAAGLNEIMSEKYIALIQNPEVWSDYRRTCLPALTPTPTAGTLLIPARLQYSQVERQSNPNIPVPAKQPVRNANDPNPCFTNGKQVTN